MELITISEVSKSFKVSTRTLRYYEQIGLLKSTKKEGYAYRAYDEGAILRLQQIIVLRKLQIPLKQISNILEDEDAVIAIEIFKKNIYELNSKINALSTIKAILINLIEKLEKKKDIQIHLNLLSNDSILNIVDTLSLSNFDFKEEKSMEDLNQATKNLEALENVRIIHLPPSTVAASHYFGENPEDNAGKQLEKFLKESHLYEIKPDARVLGFNHPCPSNDRPNYGYELWVTIPEDMDVPKPLEKKYFNGGLYAAHMITLGNFHEWGWLSNWVNIDNPKYEANTIDDNGEVMGGLLEEHLNYVYHSHLNWPESDEHQLDLLFPIKLKEKE
ncbi:MULTISPECIES: effector binding domain-containing protein [unclassified Clostridium]|uniref:effector binding domain-containing protein n=1 Tax=unclassified Clostridium TaxID=2614128 RepID=UPI0025BC3752|nr:MULTISPECIES: effector binding domain-containing protein [unclassified Clostridium]